MCRVDVMMLESSRECEWDYSLVSRCLETERGPTELRRGHPLIPGFSTHNALVTDENFTVILRMKNILGSARSERDGESGG